MPGPLRLHPGQPRLLPAVLPVVQPGASPFRHRLADPGHGALRAIPDRGGPPPGGARCRPPSAPGPLRSTATQAVALAGGGLDQQTTSTGQNDRGRKSVNSHAGCLNIIDTRRSPEKPAVPLPATVEIMPEGVTLRTRLSPNSAM